MKIIEIKNTTPVSLMFLSISLFCLLILPRLLSYGMFLDGVTYASIARNLAEGYGSIWRPYYTDTIYPEFYEQPPLFFFLQSLAFRTVGDSPRVEAFWGFGTGLLIILLIWKIWMTVRQQFQIIAGGWIPVLMFVTLPMTSWLLANNLLEGTMTIFTTFAALLAIKSMFATQERKTVMYAICSGVLILGALLVKGPVGLFPLAIPAIWLITIDRKRFVHSMLVTFLMLLGIFGPFLLLAVSEKEFLPSLSKYFSQQVLATISGSREKSAVGHFWIMLVVVREVIVPFIIATIVWVLTRLRWKINIFLSFGKNFWLYLLIGLSGSLPIMISPKQAWWYVFPSLPFYCLSVAVLFEKIFTVIERAVAKTRKRQRAVLFVAFTLFAIAVLCMFLKSGTVQKEKEFHNDFSLQPVHIPERQIISVYPPELQYNWALVANMQRQFKASLSGSIGHDYLLTTVEHQTYVDSLDIYQKIHPPNPVRYVLYVRKSLFKQ